MQVVRSRIVVKLPSGCGLGEGVGSGCLLLADTSMK